MGSYVLHVHDDRLVCGVHFGMAEEQLSIGDGQSQVDGQEDQGDLHFVFKALCSTIGIRV